MLTKLLAFLAVLAVSTSVSAQRKDAQKERAAREHYNKGILYYDLGDIEHAIAEFKEAYSISAAPGLLFNIAQAHRFKKDYEQALHFYRTYLRLQPRAINKTDVEARMKELEQLIAESQQVSRERPHGIIPPGG